MSLSPDTVRILLVEDEPKLRESLAEGLGLEGWSVTTTASGLEALHRLDSEAYDLLVLDWMLPDADGLEILRAIRARGLAVPVLMMSARSSQADQAVALQNGASEFVTKPFGFAELLARCRALMAHA